jgi:hypothetical protein
MVYFETGFHSKVYEGGLKWKNFNRLFIDGSLKCDVFSDGYLSPKRTGQDCLAPT